MRSVKETAKFCGAVSRRDGRAIRRMGLGLAAFCLLFGMPGLALSADERQESADPPVLMPPVVVQAQPIGHGGTGTLGLKEQSSGSSRLGVTLREIPASVEVITQQTMQERGLRSVLEAIQAATGVMVNDLGVNQGAFSMLGFNNQQIRLLFDGLSRADAGDCAGDGP